jgi:hypothetical protein
MSAMISTYNPVLSGSGSGEAGSAAMNRPSGASSTARISSSRSHCRAAATRHARRSPSSR